MDSVTAYHARGHGFDSRDLHVVHRPGAKRYKISDSGRLEPGPATHSLRKMAKRSGSVLPNFLLGSPDEPARLAPLVDLYLHLLLADNQRCFLTQFQLISVISPESSKQSTQAKCETIPQKNGCLGKIFGNG